MASAARDTVRTQLWPVPSIAVVLAVTAGEALPRLDAQTDAHLPAWLAGYLFGGDASAARTVLDAVAGSLITVTSLTFSLTVVTLQLASSQFSPRLLRTFTRDGFVQATLALFLATFTYALTVLRTVRTATSGDPAVVPQISVTTAFVLSLASVIGLVLFLAHLTRQIRVETMLRTVHSDALGTLHRVLDPPGSRDRPIIVPAAPPDALTVLAASSGFLIRIDQDDLLELAVGADAVVIIDRQPGSSLIEGTPVGMVWASGGIRLDPGAGQQLARQVQDAVVTGFERTAAQDIAYGLRQLTDVAVKALSPGINDPTTAVHALGHSAALLCDLVTRELGPVLLRDSQGAVRVVLHQPSLADLLDLAIAQPRRYGAADPAVLSRLFALLREVAWCAPPSAHPVIAAQLDRLTRTAGAQDFDGAERAGLASMASEVVRSLAGHWDGPNRSS